MVKPSPQKQRGKTTRLTKRVMLIGTEGKNKTETRYFNHFNQIQKEFRVQFSFGNSTDAVGIVEDIKNSQSALNFRSGDLAFAVFDADLWRTQGNRIQEAIDYAKEQKIKVVLSNPCFEVWFVLHFEDSKAPYDSSAGVIKKLKRYISGYEKKMDVFEVLWGKERTAIKHAEGLRTYHEDNRTKPSERNPMTDVDQVVKKLCGSDETVQG